jgi:signal peptidase I
LTHLAAQAKAASMENSDTRVEAQSSAPSVKKKDGLRETTRFLLLLFLFALILRSFIVAPFSIPSGSMLPTFMIGDYLFVAKWPYGYSRFSLPFGLGSFDGRFFADAPERGDIAVFRYPAGGEDDYVKRVIGLPGDTIEMRDGALWLNGEPVPRVRVADWLMPITPNSPCRTVDPDAARVVVGEEGNRFCAYDRYRETLPGGQSYYILDQIDGIADDTSVYVVPEGHYFMMGDNRDDSLDSRFSLAMDGVGPLPGDYLIGEALIIFFSTKGSAEWLEPGTWVSATRWDRIGETF